MKQEARRPISICDDEIQNVEKTKDTPLRMSTCIPRRLRTKFIDPVGTQLQLQHNLTPPIFEYVWHPMSS